MRGGYTRKARVRTASQERLPRLALPRRFLGAGPGFAGKTEGEEGVRLTGLSENTAKIG